MHPFNGEPGLIPRVISLVETESLTSLRFLLQKNKAVVLANRCDWFG